MKRFSILTVAVLMVTACAQSPTAGPTSGSSEPIGSFNLAIGPNVDLILNPGSTTELPALVADAWKEQQNLNLPELAGRLAEQVKNHNPERIEVTESCLTIIGYGKIIPDELKNAEFAFMLQEELKFIGMKFRVLQSNTTVNRVIPMSLQDGTIQNMRLTVSEVLLTQDPWIP